MSTAQASLFNSVPEKDHFHFFEKGEIDGKRVVDFFRFRKEDVAVGANLPVSNIRYDEKMSEVLRERLVEWATAINLVGSYFRNNDKTILWFQVSNPSLGGMAPRDMIRVGRFKKLLKFIQTALDENKR